MNFKEFLNENDKLKGFKSFLDSRDIVRISNDFTEKEESEHLNKTYGDYTIQNRAEAFGVNYDELVKAFGMPPKIIEDPNTGEITYKWLVWFKDGATAMVITYAYSGGSKLEDKKYWAVSGTDPADLVARIKRYIKNKGGKLLGENNKLAGLKSFVTSDQIINAKLKAPAIETVQELEKLPEKSIIWYPEHDLRVGTCITKDILLDYIKYQKKTHGSPLRQAWDVYLNGKHIDTVFFSSRGTMHYKDVLDSLIHHDGYDPDIEISTTPDITPEIETKIRNFAKEFGAITETREDELIPAVSVTDEPMDFEADEDELDFNNYSEDYINFVTKAIQKGYKFYQVAYERKFDPNNIRHWWRLLD